MALPSRPRHVKRAWPSAKLESLDWIGAARLGNIENSGIRLICSPFILWVVGLLSRRLVYIGWLICLAGFGPLHHGHRIGQTVNESTSTGSLDDRQWILARTFTRRTVSLDGHSIQIADDEARVKFVV